MRFLSFVAVTGAAIVLGACGRDKTAKTDSATTSAAAPAAMTPPAAPAAGAMAPITGNTVEIKMIGDGQGYRFEPADVTIKQGDGVKFVVISGAPHNVAFTDAATMPAAAKAALMANMPEQAGELSGKMLIGANESYTVSFAGVPAGKYNYNCTPHLAMNMKGVITVQ